MQLVRQNRWFFLSYYTTLSILVPPGDLCPCGGEGGGDGWVVGDYIRAAHLQRDVMDNIVHVSPKRRRILPEYMAPHSRSLSSPFMSVTCFNGKFVSYRRLLGLCSFFMSSLGFWGIYVRRDVSEPLFSFWPLRLRSYNGEIQSVPFILSPSTVPLSRRRLACRDSGRLCLPFAMLGRAPFRTRI